MSQFAAQPAASVIPEELLYGVDGAIATITLNAPQRMNTISGPMLKQLTDALVRANEDREVRVVILTGTGRAFCAGLNPSCLPAASAADADGRHEGRDQGVFGEAGAGLQRSLTNA